MKNGFITDYSEVKSTKPANLRAWMRDAALTGLSMLANKSHLDKPRIQFLYIHHIFKDEEQKLDNLLKKLSRNHTFISYGEAVIRILNGTIDKPYITFSSDDGFKNNLRAAEIMNRYDAKACFFVNPGIVGETDYHKINQHCSETLRFPAVEFLDWDDIAKLQKWGHEIGGHTMMHMDIARESEQKVREDLHQTHFILKDKCGESHHFAFPFGRFSNFSAAGRKATFDAGFSSCATAERGCHVNPKAPLENTDLCIRRDHIVLDWDINHILYFMVNNAKMAHPDNNLFPTSLR